MTESFNNVQLCLGVDPNPATGFNFELFQNCLAKHSEFIEAQKKFLQNRSIKIQLSFFLAHGSKGIAALEEFVHKFKQDFSIIIDGKFNDISNSLKAYLDFVFVTLGASGVTINPFLGENTLELSFENCAKYAGEKGRVYVLCATSESPQSSLSYLQENWKNKIVACSTIRNKIFANTTNYKKIAGVVIGVNRTNVLLSQTLNESQLSVLCPGLGAQGGDLSIIQQCKTQNNEFLFPISRGIFNAGNCDLPTMKENFAQFEKHFKT